MPALREGEADVRVPEGGRMTTGCLTIQNSVTGVTCWEGDALPRRFVLPVPPKVAFICPYCGGLERVTEKRGDDLREWEYCVRCGEQVDWAARLLVPCPKCGAHSRCWDDDHGGKVHMTCLICGRFEASPD